MDRRIIHLDLDAFYASAEQLDRPELLGRPVVVGGSAGRGVVCACSYEARRFGVRSAMPMARALSLCPSATVLPVRMARYRELSRKVFTIFRRFTDRVEPLSIDEAFLDVSDCERLWGDAAQIARRLRDEVRRETGLTVSAGVAPNKFLAKLASEQGKPDGLVLIAPDEVDAFLLPLPVASLWGVGRVTAAQLQRLGLRTVGDLRAYGEDRLRRSFGAAGETPARPAGGEDERPVTPRAPVKSVGHEDTFEKDLFGRPALERALLDIADRVASRLRSQRLAGERVILKLRYCDFDTVTRSTTLERPADSVQVLYREACRLLSRTEAGSRAVRLLGITVAGLASQGIEQRELFEEAGKERQKALDAALDRVRARFGREGLNWGSLLEKSAEEPPKNGGTGA